MVPMRCPTRETPQLVVTRERATTECRTTSSAGTGQCPRVRAPRPRSKENSMSLKDSERMIQKGFEEIRKELEALALRAVTRLSLSHPTKEVWFVSAMGGYDWIIRDPMGNREVKPPEERTWRRLFDEYGYFVLPTVRFIARNGKVTRETNW